MTVHKTFDLSLLEQMDGRNFVTQVVDLYIRDTETDLNAMNLALNVKNYDVIQKTAHKIKSSTGMLQANTLYRLFEQLESAAKSEENTLQVQRLLGKANEEFGHLKYELKKELEEN